MHNSYSLYVISNKPEKFAPIAKKLLPERVHYFNGYGYKSFAKLVNDCVTSAPTETVIIVSDKVLPTPDHVKKVLTLLDDGFGFVGLHRFAFFGFKKELFRRIGMFDERYNSGGFEDYDFTVRLIENNIACFISDEVEYTPSKSSWDYSSSYSHWSTKWRYTCVEGSQEGRTLTRTMSEETYNYQLGKSIPIDFLPCKAYSYVSPECYQHAGAFFHMDIK